MFVKYFISLKHLNEDEYLVESIESNVTLPYDYLSKTHQGTLSRNGYVFKSVGDEEDHALLLNDCTNFYKEHDVYDPRLTTSLRQSIRNHTLGKILTK